MAARSTFPDHPTHVGPAARTILTESTLPPATRNLVLLRASQLTGDTDATDTWRQNAARSGESPTRIEQVDAWRESSVFTEAERAALELTEHGVRITTGGVPDADWTAAAEHFDKDGLSDLVTLVALINTTNRMGDMLRHRPPPKPTRRVPHDSTC
ncbi:carboxymuconolactone decarboxylase family protein [Actinomadura harenae]|uniref:Carboxymuconolactone decarboxylase family protein n=1 Tax=Actinomadura harenae TaxID=2483351 RepID=A0A3M2LTW8_9ACTN|nr:carboxymuconolactone decarboxylase family protein [Actinomadura harenae]RMI40672.1 carboxymuconolactone decarboxylase family protein [Actinomadura harenae]